MEQRPSDSQNESANELPQSVPQPAPIVPTSADQSAVTRQSEAVVGVSDTIVNDQAPAERITTTQAAAEPPANEPVTNATETERQSSTEQDPAKHSNQPEPDQSPQARADQDQPGNQSLRSSQPTPERAGRDRSGNERPGQDKSRDPNQPRQKNNQSGVDRSGQDRPPRDPNQPQKQNQPTNERPGGEKAGNERSGQPDQPRQPNGQRSGQEKPRDPNQPQKQNQLGNERQSQGRVGNEKPVNERPGHERPGHERQTREPKPIRTVESDGYDDDIQVQTRPPDRSPTGPREETGRESDNRLIIGITLGDYNGIGPEVILKALQYNRLQKICTPVIYGSMRVLNRYRNLLELKDWNLNGIQQVEQASHKLTNVITCWPDQNQEIQPGKVTTEAGQAAFACLERAVDDLREGRLDAIVTAPINKQNIQSEEFSFPGHTEYLADAFSVADNLMFLVSERLRVGVVTGHVPLGKVRQNITRERILQKLTMMSQSLRLDFGIDKPRIAVLGLNPHAGEEGLLGNEEQEIVKPLIKQLQDKGNLVYGPFPADGFFGTRAYLKFDAVLAMYHDQGLIPFKAIAFEDGVNFTAAMPVVRTSPDHGTAYDIAGKNLADETSMLQAIYTACDVARRRRETAEIEAGALKPKRERATEK